eukprot:tig00001525_g9250.t1
MDFSLPGAPVPPPPRGARPASGFRPRSGGPRGSVPVVVSRPDSGTGWVTPVEVGDPAVIEYAKYVGLDLNRDADLLWLAYSGLHAPLPPGWTTHDDAETGAPYFYNEASGQSSYEHPADAPMRFMVQFLRDHREEMHASLGVLDLRRQLRAEMDARWHLENKLRRAADVAAQQAMEFKAQLEAARAEAERQLAEAHAETLLVRAQLHPDDVEKAGAAIAARRAERPPATARAAPARPRPRPRPGLGGEVWRDALEAAQRRHAAALEDARLAHATAEAVLRKDIEAAREEARREGAIALAALEGALEQLREDKRGVERERESLREAVQAAERALRTAEDERLGLQERLVESRQAQTRLQAREGEQEEAKAALARRVEEVQGHVRRVEELLAGRTAEALALQGRLAELEGELGEEREKSKRLGEMLERAATEFGEERDLMRTRLQAAEAVYEEEKARARGEVAEAQAALEAQRGETGRAEARVAELRGELARAGELIADLEAKVADADATLGQKYKLVVTGLEVEKRALEQRLDKVSRAASEAAAAHGEEAATLRSDAAAAKGEAADLRHRLQLALAEKEEVIASAERFQATMEGAMAQQRAGEEARVGELEARHERERSEWRVLLSKEQEERRVEVAAAVRAIAEEKLKTAEALAAAKVAVERLAAELEERTAAMRAAAKLDPEKLAELVEGVRGEMRAEVAEAVARLREEAAEEVAALRAEAREAQERWR